MKPASEANVKDAAPIAEPAPAEPTSQKPAASTTTIGTTPSPARLTECLESCFFMDDVVTETLSRS